MLFSVLNKYNYTNSHFKAKIITTAKKRILFYKTGSTELALDEYLLKKYKKSLKAICLALVHSCEIQMNNTTFIILFHSKEADELASLITYGDGRLQGSHILQVAFAWN